MDNTTETGTILNNITTALQPNTTVSPPTVTGALLNVTESALNTTTLPGNLTSTVAPTAYSTTIREFFNFLSNNTLCSVIFNKYGYIGASLLLLIVFFITIFPESRKKLKRFWRGLCGVLMAMLTTYFGSFIALSGFNYGNIQGFNTTLPILEAENYSSFAQYFTPFMMMFSCFMVIAILLCKAYEKKTTNKDGFVLNEEGKHQYQSIGLHESFQ